MAYVPTTIASSPSHACLSLRISNSFAAYLAVLVITASSCLTWLTTYTRWRPSWKRAPRSNSPPQWRIPFALFSRHSPHPLYLSFRTGTRSSTRLGPSASIATPAPLVSAPPSNKNSQMAPYVPSSTSAEPPSTMSRIGPLWNSKPDASCGVSDASDATYSACTSSFSLTISASNKSAR